MFLPTDPLPGHRDFCSSKSCVSAWLLGSVWKGPPGRSLIREVLCSPRHRPGQRGGTQSQGRGNGVPGGMADTQLLASPKQVNVSIM